MFGSSRYVVNRRGPRESSEFPESGRNLKKHISDDLTMATSIVCAHDVFRRNLPIISSTLYRTKRIQQNGDEVVILACAFYRFSVCTGYPGIDESINIIQVLILYHLNLK